MNTFTLAPWVDIFIFTAMVAALGGALYIARQLYVDTAIDSDDDAVESEKIAENTWENPLNPKREEPEESAGIGSHLKNLLKRDRNEKPPVSEPRHENTESEQIEKERRFRTEEPSREDPFAELRRKVSNSVTEPVALTEAVETSEEDLTQKKHRAAESSNKNDQKEHIHAEVQEDITQQEAEVKQKAEAAAREAAEEKARQEAEAKAQQEAEAKQKAEAAARKIAEEKAQQEAEAKAQQEAEAKQKAEAAARKAAEEKAQEAEARRKVEEEARKREEEEARRKLEEEESRLKKEEEEAQRIREAQKKVPETKTAAKEAQPEAKVQPVEGLVEDATLNDEIPATEEEAEWIELRRGRLGDNKRGTVSDKLARLLGMSRPLRIEKFNQPFIGAGEKNLSDAEDSEEERTFMADLPDQQEADPVQKEATPGRRNQPRLIPDEVAILSVGQLQISFINTGGTLTYLGHEEGPENQLSIEMMSQPTPEKGANGYVFVKGAQLSYSLRGTDVSTLGYQFKLRFRDETGNTYFQEIQGIATEIPFITRPVKE